jgi:transposase
MERHLRELDRLEEDLRVIERDLARSALADEGVARLMTNRGIDMVVALALAEAIGDIQRFEAPEKLVSYLGLNPSVRQSSPFFPPEVLAPQDLTSGLNHPAKGFRHAP